MSKRNKCMIAGGIIAMIIVVICIAFAMYHKKESDDDRKPPDYEQAEKSGGSDDAVDNISEVVTGKDDVKNDAGHHLEDQKEPGDGGGTLEGDALNNKEKTPGNNTISYDDLNVDDNNDAPDEPDKSNETRESLDVDKSESDKEEGWSLPYKGR